MTAEPEGVAAGGAAAGPPDGAELPPALKPPVDPATLVHRQLLDGPFWQRIPSYAAVSEAEFLDHRWQAKNSITSVAKLLATLSDLCPQEFFRDAEEGFKRAPMSVRV